MSVGRFPDVFKVDHYMVMPLKMSKATRIFQFFLPLSAFTEENKEEESEIIEMIFRKSEIHFPKKKNPFVGRAPGAVTIVRQSDS